jgi:hypothetical protein
MTHDPNRPTGSVPPERDRTTGGATPPPEHRGGPNRGDGRNSAMALIVGALAVVLIIGAFFWFAGDTQDTATLDDPAVTEQDMGTTQQEPMTGQDTTLGTTDQETTTEQDTTVTEVQPTEDEDVIDDTQQQGTTGQTQTQDEDVIDETQQ